MVHGGSKSARRFGGRWISAVLGALLFLTFTAASGPADFIAKPVAAVVSKPHRAPPRPSPSVFGVDLSSILVPPIGRDQLVTPVGDELLHDAPAAPAAAAATVAAASPTSTAKKRRTVWVEVTAYCPCKKCCGPSARGITSSGKPITYNDGHFIAADLKLFPYGTRVIVPGYNNNEPVEVIDRGGAIRGYHIDIFLPTHDEAVQWGKKRLQVTIVE